MKVIEKPRKFRKTLEELDAVVPYENTETDDWAAAIASLKPPRPARSISREEFCQKFHCEPSWASKQLNKLELAGKATTMLFTLSPGHRVKLWVLK